MKIYIDFDDVICETARYFTVLAKELFGIELPYEDVKFFNLQDSFGLDREQYDKMMKVAHFPENLMSLEEPPGASETIKGWIDAGHEVFVITGRPFASYEPSRMWLDEHGLGEAKLYCVDKYGRYEFSRHSTYNLTLDELYKMTFDLAIEDSPASFVHVMHFDGCKVVVFDRPWNKETEFPDERFVRCESWEEIKELL